MLKVTSNIPKIYSATHYFNEIPLISSCTVTDILGSELVLKISVLCEKKEILSFSERFEVPESQRHALVLSLKKYNLRPNEKYVHSENQISSLEVRIAVHDGISAATYSCSVRFLPFGSFTPEMPPELLCTYVMPGLSFASRIAKNAVVSSGKNATPLLIAKKLFNELLSEKLSLARHLSDLPENSLVIRDHESIINSGNRSVTLTEAALIYCSCAERIGLDTTIIYLRRGAGNIRVLIGISLDRNSQYPIINESISDLRKQILNKKSVCFDILGILGTEDTDFNKNLQETQDTIFKNNSSLAFSVNISGARLCGVSSLHPFKKRNSENSISNIEAIKNAIYEIKKKDILNTVYSFSPLNKCAIGICASSKMLKFGEKYTLASLDDDIFTKNPDAIGKFTSFTGKYPAEIARNISETTKYNENFSSLVKKLNNSLNNNCLFAYPMEHFLSCDKTTPIKIREEFSSCVKNLTNNISKTGSGEFVKLYTACGIVEFEKGGNKLYSPCVFVPCEIYIKENAVILDYGTESPVINKSLYLQLSSRLLGEDVSCDLLCEKHIAECIDAFAALCDKSNGKIILHRDIVVSSFDLSYTLMKDCIENSADAKFGRCIESGQYKMSENQTDTFGRFESNCPFGISSVHKNAVKYAENDSVIISGLHGTDKKKTCASIIAREIQKGNNVLVASKYIDSLYSLKNTFENANLSELCLVIEDAESTKAKILSDIRQFTHIPSASEKSTNGDIGQIENKLCEYNQELYHTQDFGYSLHTCIDEYCKYNMASDKEPLNIDIDIRNMTKETSEKVFELSESLSECAGKIYTELPEATISECGMSLVKTVNEIPEKTLSGLILSSNEKLTNFTQKCSFVFKSFGISEKDIADVRSLIAFGDFLELIMDTGVTNIPEKLFSGSVYKNSKFLELLCDTLSKIKKAQNETFGIYEKLTNEKAQKFYNRWYSTDNNIFAKNTIIREMREYLPEKVMLTHSRAKAILEALMEKTRLEKELKSKAPEAQMLLGDLWKNEQTDIDSLYKILTFAQSTDNYIRKIFKDEALCKSILANGISSLISGLFENNEANADFISALSDFRKLCDKNFKEGILPKISNILCLDMYELKFKNGVLGKDGLSDYLLLLCEKMSALVLLPQYNSVKKEAVTLGLSAFTDYIENNCACENINILFSKSIFATFSKYIIESKSCFKNSDIVSLRKQYCALFDQEKKMASHNLSIQHRKSFIKYISSDMGKSETYALCESLRDNHVSLQELFSKHSSILRTMYPVIFALSNFAYTLDSFPKTLILLDSEKTCASEALPLCASFDKCIFLSSGYSSENSIISALPSGIKEFRLSHLSSCKNADIVKFAKSILNAEIHNTQDISDSKIKYIKCDGGLYDKNSGANKIEAVAACEKALSLCREYGFENVGIITMTHAQQNEAEIVLDLLALKYSDEKIKNIPVRYIGAMGDLSKKYIVLSLTFGKNIYSVTRSFDLLSSPYLIKSGNISPLCELLCCEKELYIVTSVEDDEIMLDGKMPGASDIYYLLLYASKGALPLDADIDTSTLGTNIKESLCTKHNITNTRTQLQNIIYTHDTAYLFDNTYNRDTYDREILPAYEMSCKGYKVEFWDICDLL